MQRIWNIKSVSAATRIRFLVVIMADHFPDSEQVSSLKKYNIVTEVIKGSNASGLAAVNEESEKKNLSHFFCRLWQSGKPYLTNYTVSLKSWLAIIFLYCSSTTCAHLFKNISFQNASNFICLSIFFIITTQSSWVIIHWSRGCIYSLAGFIDQKLGQGTFDNLIF